MEYPVVFKFRPGDLVRITRFDKVRKREIILDGGVVDCCYVGLAGTHHYSIHRMYSATREQSCYLECELEPAPPIEKKTDANDSQTE